MRIPGLDGLRAIAVLGVMLFHSHLPGTELGWAGVELFFVISGFLITGILLDLRGDPHYLRTFYARRALRILPLYYFVLAVSVGVAFALGRSIASLDVPFYLVYVQNYIPQISSQMIAGIPLTTHTWTLAVEEQFYWLWPLVILMVRRGWLRPVLIVCVLGAPIARLALLLWTANPYAAVASLPAQVDALAAGASLALAMRSGMTAATTRRVGLIAIVGGAAVLSALVVRGGSEMFGHTEQWAAEPINVLLLTGAAAFSIGIVAFVVSGRSGAVRLLEWGPLPHIGRISYGLYIYNPLMLFVASLLLAGSERLYVEGGVAETLLGGLLTYAIAVTSWRYLEAPLLRLRGRVAPTAASPTP